MKKLDKSCADSPETTRFSRRFANAGLLLGPAGVAASMAGCSGYAEDDSEAVTLSEGLNPAYWRTWSGALTAPAPWVDEPTLCSNSIPAVTYVVKSGINQRYYVRQALLSLAPSWKVFDSTPRVFASPPSCVMEHPAGTVPQPSGLPLFLIAGKSENKIFVVEGEVQNAGPDGVPVNPIWKGPWTQVSSTTYGAFQGYPALGSNGQKVVVTFMSNNTIYAHTRSLPYSASGNSWSARIAGPRLPTGVSIPTEPEGYYAVPGVIYMGGAHNKFLMMVRAQNASGTKRLYYITFSGTSFGSWSGPASTSTHSIDSDPALEFDHEYDALSVYFRSGNEIKHTSVVNPSNIGSEPIWAIDEPASPVMYGAPRVVWGGGTEGNRTLLVRGFLPSTPDNLKSRTILGQRGCSRASALGLNRSEGARRWRRVDDDIAVPARNGVQPGKAALLCYTASMRPGRTKTTSFSLDDATLRNLKRLAARRHKGNVSALLAEVAAREAKFAAAEAFFEKHGVPPLDEGAVARIEAEWRGEPQPKKKPRRRAA